MASPVETILTFQKPRPIVADADLLEAEPFAVILPSGEKAEGWIATPLDGRPTALVVVCHAFGHEVEHLLPTLVELAEHGAVAVAMQFRGPVGTFNVKNGVEDTTAATKFLLSTYPSINTTIIYGYSMGGAVSGATIAALPPDTFDHWIAGAGVTDLASFWQNAEPFRSLVEAETGGRPREARDAYAARSPRSMVDEIAAANLTSVVFVHARADPIVQFSDSYELYEELATGDVPTTLIAIGGTELPWSCSRWERVCLANPYATLESHGVGHVPTIMPLLLGLLDGSWQPTPGMQEVYADEDERAIRLIR